MDAAMYKALSGAVVEMRRLDVAAQDLANLNTAGYKGQRLAFSEVLARRVPPEDRAGGFVAVAAQKTNLNQGSIEASGNPFHLALEGDGYFVVQTARGERYTRNGSFTMKADGTVITPQGDALLGEGGPIQLSTASLVVAPDGSVSSKSDGLPGAANTEIGKLRIVRFNDSRKVEKEGANLFRSDPANVTDATEIRLIQGHLEQSNVSAVDSMVNLIALNRQFESYQRAMKLLDSATEKVISDSAR